jgi:hypothetical protein
MANVYKYSIRNVLILFFMGQGKFMPSQQQFWEKNFMTFSEPNKIFHSHWVSLGIYMTFYVRFYINHRYGNWKV